MRRRTTWACSTHGCFQPRWRRLAICLRCRTALFRGLYR